MFAFTGEVYRGLDAKTLDEKAVKYLEKNFRILSGLYGLLKPSDKVMLYRLEMGRPFHFDSYKNLYEFWTDKVTQQLNSELKKDELLINLASNEYGKVVDRKKLKAKVIDFDFKQIQPDGICKNWVVLQNSHTVLNRVLNTTFFSLREHFADVGNGRSRIFGFVGQSVEPPSDAR